MGVPKGRRTKSKQGHRRSHLGIAKKTLTTCSNCGKVKSPHHVCQNCGQYKGRQVIDVLAKLSKRERKEKEKALAADHTQSQEQTPQKDLSVEELSRPK